MPARIAPARVAGRLLTLPLLLLLLLLPLAGAAHAHAAGPSVRFDLKDGDKVSDTVTIVARAATDDINGIEKVEFSVDGQLKATDTSTSYTLAWDTLADTEGAHTITATAYDSTGATATAKVSLTVDNELGKGADFYADAALDSLKGGDAEAASRFCRRALKIAPTNVRAARALAAIQRKQGEIDQAVATLEKAAIPDDDTVVRADLVALHILRGDELGSTEGFLKEADAAVQIYRQLQAARLAAIKGADPAAVAMQKGDVEYAASNWPEAIRYYQQGGTLDEMPAPFANRLALAYLNTGRLRDAGSIVRMLNRTKRADEATHAVEALMLFDDHQRPKARVAVQDGIAAKSLAALIMGAYTDLSLKDRKRASAESEQAAAAAPSLPDVHLLRAYLVSDPIDARREVLAALQANPMLPQAYALLAFQTLLSSEPKATRYPNADALLAFGARLDPTSQYVLMGRAISALAQNRTAEVEPLLKQLHELDKTGPDIHVVAACYYSQLDKQIQVTEELKAAFQIDAERWNYFRLPKPDELLRDIYRYRYAPVLSPASLYPAQG